MKILIVGSADSIHINRLANFLKKEFEVFILPFKKIKNISSYNNIEILPPMLDDIYFQKSKIGKILYLYDQKSKILRVINSVNPSVINIQYLYIQSIFIFHNLRINIPLVVSFWGGDIWLPPKNIFHLFIQKKLVKKSSVITVISKSMKRAVISRFGPETEDKIRFVRYIMIDPKLIDSITEEEMASFKAKYKIPQYAIVIGISYASAPRHRQDKILRVLENIGLKKLKKHNVHIIIPLTYGDSQWREYIKSIVNGSDLREITTIIEDFMPDREVAALRKLTDIFINVPTQDTFSASMLENIYSCGIVITGKWLPYDELFESDAFIIKLDKFDEHLLYISILDALENLEIYKQKACQVNPLIAVDIVSKYLNSWIKIFKEVAGDV